MKEDKWELDLFSTILSRKHAFHKIEGKKRFVRVKKQTDAQQQKLQRTQKIAFLDVTV